MLLHSPPISLCQNAQSECGSLIVCPSLFVTVCVCLRSSLLNFEMDFDLDDPLGDLLSDGSNDSFFGTSKKPSETKKSSGQTTTTTDVKSKAKVADLFGFDDEKTTNPIESASKSNSDKKPVQSTAQSLESKKTVNKEENASNPINNRQSIKPSTPVRGSLQSFATETSVKGSEVDHSIIEPVKSLKKETRFDDSDDFLNELGFDPKHPKGNIGKKTNILDDILNFSKPEKLPKVTSTPSASKPLVSDVEANRKQSNAKPLENNPSSNRYSPSLGRPRNAQSGSSSTADPLGLFSTPTKKSQESRKDEVNTPLKTKSKPLKKSTVDWLGLDDDSDEKQKESLSNDSIEAKAELSKPITAIHEPVTSSKTVLSEGIPVNTSTMMTTTATDITTNLNLMTMASLEKEQAVHSLQQQQTQLRIAAQMKQQESMLHDMHQKQHTLIKQQENQFNDLLQRQITRQSQLEAQIQQQQDQINAYINVLMNQPSIGLTPTKMSTTDFNEDSRPNDEADGSRPHFIELEADVKRLELDKLRLEDTLQSIQTSHEQELELLHSSHK